MGKRSGFDEEGEFAGVVGGRRERGNVGCEAIIGKGILEAIPGAAKSANAAQSGTGILT